jgi:hypothetical protein
MLYSWCDFGRSKKDPPGFWQANAFLRIESAAVLTQPEVEELLDKVAIQVRKPFPRTGRGRLIIRTISKKQRPRRKP